MGRPPRPWPPRGGPCMAEGGERVRHTGLCADTASEQPHSAWVPPPGMPETLEEGIAAWERPPVGYVLIHRPRKANSYTQTMLDALGQAVQAHEADGRVRLIVVTGAGLRAFCAGADRDELARGDYRRALDLKSHAVFGRLAACSKVTLAAINGAAVGGGLELALACDLRVAVEEATFALPEPTLGIIPAAGGLRRLVPVVGLGRAKELVLGGAVWAAREAERYHLVHRVTARSRLWDAVDEWAQQVCRRDPLALRLAKEVLDHGGNGAEAVEKIIQALLYQLKNPAAPKETESTP